MFPDKIDVVLLTLYLIRNMNSILCCTCEHPCRALRIQSALKSSCHWTGGLQFMSISWGERKITRQVTCLISLHLQYSLPASLHRLLNLSMPYPYILQEPKKRKNPFRGTGRTIGSSATSDSPSAEPTGASSAATTQPPPSTGPVVDDSLPSTSIQLRLADGTRIISRFNLTHTIRDIQSFIGASRPSGPGNYQLQTMGFPPKQLIDLNQTIEEAGIANSVVIQKLWARAAEASHHSGPLNYYICPGFIVSTHVCYLVTWLE